MLIENHLQIAHLLQRSNIIFLRKEIIIARYDFRSHLPPVPQDYGSAAADFAALRAIFFFSFFFSQRRRGAKKWWSDRYEFRRPLRLPYFARDYFSFFSGKDLSAVADRCADSTSLC